MHKCAGPPGGLSRPAVLNRAAVLAFGIVLSVAGSIYLAVAAGVLASLLALLTLLSYLFLYTPLKRRTPLCVLVGAFPGAMPPLIGWAAASGRLNMEAWLLYAVLFLWQFPHFMAIAWMYREDYDRAGYSMLPKGNARIAFVILQTMLPLFALVPISIVQFPAAARDHFLLGGYSAGSRLPLLWFGIRASAVEGSSTPAARSFDSLSSTLVRAESCFPVAGTLPTWAAWAFRLQGTRGTPWTSIGEQEKQCARNTRNSNLHQLTQAVQSASG